MIRLQTASAQIQFGKLSDRVTELWHDNRLPEASPALAKEKLDGFERTLQAEQDERQTHQQAVTDLADTVSEQLKKAYEQRNPLFITGLFAQLAETRQRAESLPPALRQTWEDGVQEMTRQTQEAALTYVARMDSRDGLRLLDRLSDQRKAGAPIPDAVMNALREKTLKLPQQELKNHIARPYLAALGFESQWYRPWKEGSLPMLPGLLKLQQSVETAKDETRRYPAQQREVWHSALQGVADAIETEWRKAVRNLKPGQAHNALEQLAQHPAPVPDHWALPLLQQAAPVEPQS